MDDITQTSATASLTVFTASVEADHADDLRAERDRSDADIRREFFQPLDAQDLSEQRAHAAVTRLTWTRDAVDRAVARAITAAADTLRFDYLDECGDPAEMPDVDLEGATITVTVSDLTATATLTLAARD